ncbi:MAG TPA: group II intron reverse transcriptase/maturase, partial [Candidatus Udaeobacter sp.]|nr:group II intron reverse transcriptase/maturase [Candidatus Udaeobacter sp.]
METEVWTERMLATLETGIEGGKWFRLIDKVWSAKNLGSALAKVVTKGGSAGIDKQSARQIEGDKDQTIRELEQELRASQYQPQAVKRVWIPKPGSNEKRPLGVPTLRDRIVQGALLQVIEPIFERDFALHSYGFRPGKGCKEALRRVDELLKGGSHWVVDADLKSYFDTIPQERLMDRVREKIADGRVLRLLEQMLQAGVMDSVKGWQPSEQGTPQGAVVSPLLSNIYLDGLDWQMAEGGFEMVRYADDFIVLCSSQQQAQEALERVRRWVEENGLSLHPVKTRLVDASQAGGFDFLGYHFERGMKWPRKKSMDKLKDTIRSKTRRTDGRSLKAICEDLNRTLRGWFGYFKHSKANTFESVDGYTRGRLRSILRKRMAKSGHGRGFDHHRWPNAYFSTMGLFSLR